MIDVDHQISAVERTVGDRVLEAGEARVLTTARPTTRRSRTLWDACTSPSASRAGSCRSPATCASAAATSSRATRAARSSAATRRARFAATWEYGDEVSWIEVRLDPDGDGRTASTLEHIAHVDDERWLQYGPGAVGVGWDSR